MLKPGLNIQHGLVHGGPFSRAGVCVATGGMLTWLVGFQVVHMFCCVLLYVRLVSQSMNVS